MLMALSHHSPPPCPSAAKITAKLLLSFLVLSPLLAGASARLIADQDLSAIPGDVLAPGPVIVGGSPERDGDGVHEFSLRQILHHGTHKYPGMLRRLDIYPDTLVATEESQVLEPRPRYRALSQLRGIKRLSDRTRDTMEAHLLSHRYGLSRSFSLDTWVTEETPQPNITDKATVLTLAKIAANAYIEVDKTEGWLDVGAPYNRTDDFGWEGDGLRGHIFADGNNSTVIIGLKGTSPAVFDGAETTTNDKVNDNLLFSCCCARVSYWWSTVCDCYAGTAYTCDTTCLKDELMAENRYYRAALQLYYNVTQIYPDANIWVVGHSLGGAISSLIGQTYGLPVVAFEAPGEAMASERLGLPMPPNGARQSSDIGVYHFGHTADPIFMGSCNGPTSPCSIGGYAMESHCHSGMECVYDVVGDRGWRMGLGYHRIQAVIKDVIETYDDVPVCTFDPGCVDCFNWKFEAGNGTRPTTTPTKPTTTATTTCLTPGWWGCRDIPSTTGEPNTTSATQTWTETCSHYGWFGGCLDPTTTPATSPTTSTVTTTTTSKEEHTSAPSETCTHYGWFGGCLDDTPEATASTTASTTTTAAKETHSATPTETCSRYGWFGGCIDPTTTTTTGAPKPTGRWHHGSGKCRERALWGWCRDWSGDQDEAAEL